MISTAFGISRVLGTDVRLATQIDAVTALKAPLVYGKIGVAIFIRIVSGVRDGGARRLFHLRSVALI